jgi:sulfur relay (sulfurtransferase) DsrC/TusE family protein
MVAGARRACEDLKNSPEAKLVVLQKKITALEARNENLEHNFDIARIKREDAELHLRYAQNRIKFLIQQLHKKCPKANSEWQKDVAATFLALHKNFITLHKPYQVIFGGRDFYHNNDTNPAVEIMQQLKRMFRLNRDLARDAAKLVRFFEDPFDAELQNRIDISACCTSIA